MRKQVKRPVHLVGSHGQPLVFKREALHEAGEKLGISKSVINYRIKAGHKDLDTILSKTRLPTRSVTMQTFENPETLRQYVRNYASKAKISLAKLARLLGYSVHYFRNFKMNDKQESMRQTHFTQADIAAVIRIFNLPEKEAHNLWVLAAREKGWRV